MNPPRRAALLRRGATTAAAVGALAIGALSVGGLVLYGPRWTGAASRDREPGPATAARDAGHRRTAEVVAGLMRESREILRISGPGATRFSEIVLWLEDAGRPGTLELEEIAIVSHSDLLGTILLHHVPRGAANGESVRLEEALSPGFPDALRAHPGATRRVIGTDVRAFAAVPASHNDGPFARVDLRLDWDGDPADEPDVAALVVEAVLHRRLSTGDQR